MSTSSETFLFFLKLPDLKSLVTLHMDVCSADEPSQRSLFHLKMLKCRELIFKESTVLATPVKFGISHIKAVVPKASLDSVEFREYRRKIGIEIVGVEETTVSTFQECLQYTCVAKLAPAWNVLQDILVQGPAFLTTSNPLSAVKMDMYVSSNEISLCLKPACIKLPPMRLEQYATPEQLATSSIIRLEGKCHVLPSLKMGNIWSITRIPGCSGLFKNYSEIQTHWKDMYGYLLPEIPENCVWYFNVIFRFPNSTSYTYPQFCVRPYGLTVVPRVDPRPVLCTFIKDFCKRVGNICGEKCRIVEGRASFAALELFPAVKISEGMKPRPGTTYVMKPTVPYRRDMTKSSPPSFSNSHANDPNKENKNGCPKQTTTTASSSILQSQLLQMENRTSTPNEITMTKSVSNSKTCTSQTTSNEESKENIIKNPLAPSTNFQSPSQPNPSELSYQNASKTSQKKYAPCFYASRPKSVSQPLVTSQSVPERSPYAPRFFPKKTSNSVKKTPNNTPNLPKCVGIGKEPATKRIFVKTVKEPVKDREEVKNCWRNFSVKKKGLSEEAGNENTKVEKYASTKKRKTPQTSLLKEKKVTVGRRAKK